MALGSLEEEPSPKSQRSEEKETELSRVYSVNGTHPYNDESLRVQLMVSILRIPSARKEVSKYCTLIFTTLSQRSWLSSESTISPVRY